MMKRVTSVLFVLAMLLAGANAARELQGKDYSGGGTCTAIGISGQMGEVQDLWGGAVASAMTRACSLDGTANGRTVIDRWVDDFSGYARAAVRVYAKAVAKCTTTGNTIGCANAKAAADKEVEATAHVYALALANAANKCDKCDPNVNAWIASDLIVKITAAAKVRVHARVCAVGNDQQLQVATKECWASSVAYASAYAFAKAVIKGGCLDQTAKAKVEAFVNVHVDDPTCACTYWKRNNNNVLVWVNPPNSMDHCKFHDYAL